MPISICASTRKLVIFLVPPRRATYLSGTVDLSVLFNVDFLKH